MDDNIIGYCAYCKCEVLNFEKYRIVNGELFHNDKANNCLNQSQLYIDIWGDNVFDEEI